MTRDYPYLYLGSLRNAREYNELPQWRESHQHNVACKEAIEEAIRNGFDGMHLDRDCAKGVIEDYLEELMKVPEQVMQAFIHAHGSFKSFR